MTEDTTENKSCKGKAPGLSFTDVAAITACWAGVVAVTFFSKDPVVAVIAIAAAYYLAKWIILKQEK